MAAGRKTGGRQKGTPNKRTALISEAMLGAFEHNGGQKWLNAWAKRNEDVFLGQVLPKLLPLQVNHADNEGGKLVIATGVPRPE